MTKKMKVSVIIPTYNRSNKLINLLNALEKQTFKDFETVIVDDDSTDSTQYVLKSSQFSLASLKTIHQQNKGHAVARNRGTEEASGDLLIFLDSDVRPFPDCVERHVYHHTTKRGSMLAGRAVMDNTLFQDSDICQYRYYLERKIWSFPSQNGLATVTPDNYFFSTQNLSLSNQLFNDLGKFDETLKDSVDFDLCVRAMIENIRIYYDHRAAVWHDDQGNLNSYVKRQIQYRNAREHLLLKKPHYKDVIPEQFSYGKSGWIRIILRRLFIFNQIWEKILNHRWYTKIIPRWLRFKFYGYLIHCSSIPNLKI